MFVHLPVFGHQLDLVPRRQTSSGCQRSIKRMTIPLSEVYLSVSVSTTEYNLGFKVNCTENVKLNKNK